MARGSPPTVPDSQLAKSMAVYVMITFGLSVIFVFVLIHYVGILFRRRQWISKTSLTNSYEVKTVSVFPSMST